LVLERLLKANGQPVCVLDGDQLRQGLCADLGYVRQDRQENVRRAAEMARLLNQNGIIAIVALISPFREDREMARRIVGDAAFHEIHVATPLAVCEQRDPKQLYQKARAGIITQFTGVTDSYEAPLNPALVLDTQGLSAVACAALVLAKFQGVTNE
jgi:adenylylsulfate kinase